MLCRTLIAGAMLIALVFPAFANDPPPDAAAAAAFIAKAEADLAAASELWNRAQWVHDTNITVDTEALNAKASADASSLQTRLAKQAARYDATAVDPSVRRRLDILKRYAVLPSASTPGAATEIADLSSKMETHYAKSVVRIGNADRDIEALHDLLGTIRKPDELKFIWEQWRTNFLSKGESYSRLVDLTNAGARELGHRDVGALWRSQYDMPEAQFAALVDRLWSQVAPLYRNLHCYARSRLNALYGESVQQRTGPMRADLLGHMSAVSWTKLYDVLAAPLPASPVDLDRLLPDHGYDVEKIVRTAENFYTSLGFAPLPETFWRRSMFTKPQGRDVACHPTAFSIDGKDDLRVKVCFKSDDRSFQTAHHELGHNFYYRAYQDQPYLFQDGANDGFHEAIGDFIALYTSAPTYLKQIGLLSDTLGADSDLPQLMRMSLEHIPALPFSVIMDRWRWRVFAGGTPPADYNKDWWALVRQFQGLVPPGPRPENAFDAGAHYHIPASTPYTRYFLATIYQFQFFRAACRIAGWTGPLNRCSIYGNKQVGERLNAMLKLGSSKPWPEALEAFTGEREIDASAIRDYFAPLDRWLTEQNRGQTCGW